MQGFAQSSTTPFKRVHSNNYEEDTLLQFLFEKHDNLEDVDL
jgi:hypothetical protein